MMDEHEFHAGHKAETLETPAPFPNQAHLG
ncbi:hypothetical protein M527_25730 [Sphingobium indicum IP26]|nr:hypothetical protein M527_25730 [Sphingobium indicum IP26]EQB03048.1 hypothetical protein L286_13590 [Sphingobium sp. HDIP04]